MKSSSAATLPLSTFESQGSSVDRDAVTRSTDVDRWLALMNQAIDDSAWARKQDALATFMGIDKAYLSRLRSGDKPWRVEHVVSLPDDIESRFETLRAESFGAIVVQPLTGLDAQKAFVAGLVGLMSAPQLPEKANTFLKADLVSQTKKASR